MRAGLEKTKIKFGTSGWRGIISSDFTVENLTVVVQAIANYLRKTGDIKDGIIVGYDTRFMSDRFAIISCNILRKNNIPVFLTNRDTPTPVIALHILKKHTLGAINITASHNPPQYNGLKFSSSYGGPASVEVTSEIEKEIKRLQEENIQIPYSVEPENVNIFNPRPVYIKQISNLINLSLIKKSKIKIAIDCMYGTSRGYLDYILQKINKDVVTLHDKINPGFDGGSPSPSYERLKKLRDIVIKSNRHVGLATDGDADRFGIIDRDGSFIGTNYVLALVLEHLLKTRKHTGGIVRSMPTTHLLDAIARRFNREIYEVPVGFKYVGSTLLEKNAVMGCEESGGMTIYGHIPEKDGILACLLIAEIIAYNKKSLKKLLQDIGNRYGRFYNNRIDVTLKQEDMEPLMSKLKNNPLEDFAGIKVSKYETLPEDNFKIELIDGSWIIIRPSGTEPILRCYIETSSPKKYKILENHLKNTILKI